MDSYGYLGMIPLVLSLRFAIFPMLIPTIGDPEPNYCTSSAERPVGLVALIPLLCIERTEEANLKLRIMHSGNHP